MYNKILTISFCGFLGIFFMFNVLSKDKEFSELENRYLEKMPEFSVESLIDGSFTSKFEKYLTDQFILRDEFVMLKSISEKALGRKENNGVYLGDNGYLLQRFELPDEKILSRNIEAVENFASIVDIPVYASIIPTSVNIYSEKLPKFAYTFDENIILNKVQNKWKNAKYIDIQSELQKNKNEYIYYKTDHHWTSLGAYFGYKKIMETMGKPPKLPANLSEKVVSSDFYGTYHSKALDIGTKPDILTSYIDDKNTKVAIYENQYPRTGTLYDESFIDKKDKYSYFLGGNFPQVKLSTGNGNGNLLIIKDSYSNALAPFFLDDYKQITMLDLRFYKLPISEFIKENNIDEVLILYSSSNFATDTNLTFLK